MGYACCVNLHVGTRMQNKPLNYLTGHGRINTLAGIDFPRYQSLVKAVSVGKQLPDAVYVHKSAICKVPEELATLTLQMAKTFEIQENEWNIVKLFKRAYKITFLNYPRFDEYAYPELHHSFTVDLQRFSVRKANYSKSENPPILHRKEAFVSEDHPHYTLFKEITCEGEKEGLYEVTRNIGFKKHWERLIATKGCFLDDSGRLHKKGKSTKTIPSIGISHNKIERHKTAIARNKLSTPMQILARHGYLDGNYSVLDYGCGKGDDIRELESHGIDVTGWDPIHRPDGELKKCDIVNLGFVLNVIENINERKETLIKAFSYAKKVFIASVMVAGENIIRRFTPYKDGVITSRNTFQRYYTQSEFKEYLESSLNQSAIAVGQGTFLIFKDKLEEQLFLFERQHIRRNWKQLTVREARTQTKQVTRNLIEKHKEIFSDFWETTLDLGRIPANSEFEFSERIRSIAGSHKKAFDALKDYFGEETYLTAQQARRNDLLVYFALGKFARRKPYNKMPDNMKRDIKAFFNNYTSAIEESTKLLFSVGNPRVIEEKAAEAYKQHPIGEFTEGHSWIIPKKLLTDLPPELRIYVGCACQLYGDIDDIHLIKIHFVSGKVSLLKYDDFDKQEPLLLQRIKIKLRQLDIDFFDYGGEYPAEPLKNKELFTN